MYTRYEVKNKENTYHCGLLTCLDDIDISWDLKFTLTENFDNYLKTPGFYYETGKKGKKNVLAYFTEAGLLRFKKDIEMICEVVKEKGYEIVIIEQDKVGSARLVYEDKYQVLIRRK